MEQLSAEENERIDQEAREYEREQEYFMFLGNHKNTKNPEPQTQFGVFMNGMAFN